MEEKTLFALRAPEIKETGYISVPATASTKMVQVYSTKTKILNGSPTSEITTLGCSVNPQRGDWYTVGEKPHMGNGSFTVEIHITQNDGNARTAKITLTQDESGNRIVLQLTQEAHVTYTDVLELPQLKVVTVGSNKGSSATIEVTSYSLGSDGSKVVKRPSVENPPSWVNQVAIKPGSSEHKYQIVFTATTTNTSDSSLRTSPVTITCGTATGTIYVVQEHQPNPPKFTLSGLPTDTGYYLFGPGARPQTTTNTSNVYIQGISATGTTTLYIPFSANDSQPGSRVQCTTGDHVSVYTKSPAWILEGSFRVPSAGGSVSI